VASPSEFIGHICALLLCDSDIRSPGTSGPEPEPDNKKNSRISGHPELDIRYIPINGHEGNLWRLLEQYFYMLDVFPLPNQQHQETGRQRKF